MPILYRSPESCQDAVYRLWKSMPDEKKETILDIAMRGHPVVQNCDLDDRVRTGDIAYMRVVFFLVSANVLIQIFNNNVSLRQVC